MTALPLGGCAKVHGAVCQGGQALSHAANDNSRNLHRLSNARQRKKCKVVGTSLGAQHSHGSEEGQEQTLTAALQRTLELEAL